jgi:hypothetical protein
MGREIKRVALDFTWPLDKVWEGFINPFWKFRSDCPHCEGSGCSKEAEHLKNLWYGYEPFKPEDRGSVPFLPTDPPVWNFATRNVAHSPEYYGASLATTKKEALRLAELFNRSWSHHLNQEDVDVLVKEGRLADFTHTFDRGEGWKLKDPPYYPTAKEVNEWSIRGGFRGHDSINQWVVCKAECERKGWPSTCSHCNGEGCVWESKEYEKQYDEWEKVEPPAGEGYQLWETVSEGSPVSPVFSTPEELATWLTTPGNYSWCDKDTPYETWVKFIKGDGWAPSDVIENGRVMTGVEAMVE